jgi:hypothetical protein
MTNGTVSNLIQGVGELYSGAFGATEPAATAIATTPASATWTDVGFTTGGVRLTYTPTYSELSVDQVVDDVGRRLTRREFTISTSMAEATLANLSLVTNDVGATSTGTGYEELTPSIDPGPEDEPTHKALIFDGFAEGFSGGTHFRRRVVGRRMLQTGAWELGYMEDNQTVLAVEWRAHFVSSSIAPWQIIDAE